MILRKFLPVSDLESRSLGCCFGVGLVLESVA